MRLARSRAWQFVQHSRRSYHRIAWRPVVSYLRMRGLLHVMVTGTAPYISWRRSGPQAGQSQNCGAVHIFDDDGSNGTEALVQR